jgi:hypothetical protein
LETGRVLPMKPNPVWYLPAVGCTNLSNTGGRRELLYAGGFRRIDVLVAEGDLIHQLNIDELKNIADDLVSQGWTICTWHSTTGKSSPNIEAETAYAAIKQVEEYISGHNLNAEDWYEGANKWRTAVYFDRFFDFLDLPVAVWPMGSDAPTFPRNFDYKTCVELGCMVYPQQYANLPNQEGFTIPTGDINLKAAGVPVENRGTSPGCYGPSVPWDAYAADLEKLPRPVLLYAADLSGFDAIQATKLVPDLPPQEPPMPVIGTQHGIRAMFNRLRDLDSGGTLLQKVDGKWPSIASLADTPIEQWKAYDKAERAMTILVTDHDTKEEL